MEFNADQLKRYSRHILLDDVGLEGQKRLAAARVLIIGAGGLGSPAAMYLAAAGVGTLGIADFDQVDLSNLQRQVLHGTSDVGRLKTESAKDALNRLNPNTQVVLHPHALKSNTVMDVFQGYDIVVDGSDNFPTRYLANDACIFQNKPYVFAGVSRFEGQVSVFGKFHSTSPCYRCLFPEPPEPGAAPSCADIGVLGVAPGLAGLLQAAETIKLIIKKGDPLIGRLLCFNILPMSFRTVCVRRDPRCPVCADVPQIREPIDYERFCGTPLPPETVALPRELSGQDIRDLQARGEPFALLDVREHQEQRRQPLPNAMHIPLERLAARAKELSKDKFLLVVCQGGLRSLRAIHKLHALGFRNVGHVGGGLLALPGGAEFFVRTADNTDQSPQERDRNSRGH